MDNIEETEKERKVSEGDKKILGETGFKTYERIIRNTTPAERQWYAKEYKWKELTTMLQNKIETFRQGISKRRPVILIGIPIAFIVGYLLSDVLSSIVLSCNINTAVLSGGFFAGGFAALININLIAQAKLSTTGEEEEEEEKEQEELVQEIINVLGKEPGKKIQVFKITEALSQKGIDTTSTRIGIVLSGLEGIIKTRTGRGTFYSLEETNT